MTSPDELSAGADPEAIDEGGEFSEEVEAPDSQETDRQDDAGEIEGDVVEIETDDEDI
jgi:hypothetical protein